MIAAERQRRILTLLERENIVTVQRFCDELDVSHMTVRRDLFAMEEDGLLRRVRGGAQSIRSQNGEPGREQVFQARMKKHSRQKKQIGQAAAKLIKEGQSIFLDGSSTSLHLAEYVRDLKNITVLTDSLAVLITLADNNNIELVTLGGSLQDDGNTIDGPMAMENVERLAVDTLFFSCSGFDVEGVYNPGLIGTNIKRVLIRKASRHVLLAGAEKFGIRDFYALCPLSAVNTIISDSGLDLDARQAIQRRGTELIIAS